ncbi:MgtC/SapB family protein [Candidatus Poribacteria bacterium]|nr:MgtC/SapB family protein [Candidatus Poribacteria bacterium]
MNPYTDILFKVLASIVFGGLIGLERERHNQPAGLKTHIILCVGATLITIVSIDMARDLGGREHTDPTRIAAQIVSGIGFLGGGAILRMGGTVRGLTTAACLWTVTGVGMAIGGGYYFAAALTILTVLLTLHFLGRLEKVFLHRKAFKEMTLIARSSPDLLGSVEKVLSANLITIRNIEVQRDLTEPNVELNALVMAPERINLHKVSDEIFQIPGTIRFELE